MVAGHEQSSVPVEALRRSVDAGFGAALTDLGRLVAIPGIAWPGYDPAELERSTEVVAELLAGTGLPEVRIIRCATEDGAPGDPAVIARRAAAPGRRTVLLYAHHDVQPAAPPPQHWISAPFTATERSGRLCARGTADDKAGIMLHVAALRAAHELSGDGLGITVLIEGEEETGSPTLPALFAGQQELVRADVVVVAESGNWQVGVPALTTSLRGLVDGVVEIRALDHGPALRHLRWARPGRPHAAGAADGHLPRRARQRGRSGTGRLRDHRSGPGRGTASRRRRCSRSGTAGRDGAVDRSAVDQAGPGCGRDRRPGHRGGRQHPATCCPGQDQPAHPSGQRSRPRSAGTAPPRRVLHPDRCRGPERPRPRHRRITGHRGSAPGHPGRGAAAGSAGSTTLDTDDPVASSAFVPGDSTSRSHARPPTGRPAVRG